VRGGSADETGAAGDGPPDADESQGQRQSHTGSTAPAGPSRDIRSDDAKFGVAETQRLQQEAQARINAGRHDTIGKAP
jgi:hypothetical protein